MFRLISEHILARKLEHFVFHFLKISSSEGRSPRPQTARPLLGCVRTEPEYLRLPPEIMKRSQRCSCHAAEADSGGDAVLALKSGLAPPLPHRFPHNSRWCVTANQRAQTSVCASYSPFAEPRRSYSRHVGVLMRRTCPGSLVVTRLLVNRSTGTRVWGTSGGNMGKTARRLLITNTSETSRCTKAFVVSFYSYKKPENEKLPFTWE